MRIEYDPPKETWECNHCGKVFSTQEIADYNREPDYEADDATDAADRYGFSTHSE